MLVLPRIPPEVLGALSARLVASPRDQVEQAVWIARQGNLQHSLALLSVLLVPKVVTKILKANRSAKIVRKVHLLQSMVK